MLASQFARLWSIDGQRRGHLTAAKNAFYRTFAFGNLNALKGGINIDKWRADGTSIFEG
jgi:hypothetical protein